MSSEIYAQIQNAKHILLIAHVNPDADSMGSALAMYTHMLQLQKKVTLYCKTEKINPALHFLPFFDKVRHQLPKDYDLAMSFDCGALSRLGVTPTVPLINFDHHVSNDRYGSENIIDTAAISTSQVVFDFMIDHDIKINAKMATALYAGLIDDSQNFKSSDNTCIFCSLSLGIIEISWDCNDSMSDCFTQVSFCNFLHFNQDHC